MASRADIVFYGGAAGCAKSFTLLLDAGRYHKVRGFGAVIFRKTYPEITNQGGLWDESENIYPWLGGIPRLTTLDWSWPQYRSSISFSHFQHAANKESWKGSQIPFIGWDEVTSFDEEIFWYMFSRNRSTCGVEPCIRCTTNPEPGSWVAKLLDWWIGADGFPRPDRDGVLRWFARSKEGKIIWADQRSDLPDPSVGKSLTFIRGRLEDNTVLNTANPSYRASLLAMPAYERQILLDGNWKVRKSAGTRFRRTWFKVVDEPSAPVERTIRYWDRAGTEPTETNKEPDWTAGVKVSRLEDGRYCVRHVERFQTTPAKVRKSIANLASQDGQECELCLEEDPGQAGKAEAEILSIELAEFGPSFVRPTGSKWVRSTSASAAAERGLIEVERGDWNDDFFDELESFADPDDKKAGVAEKKDDQVDGLSGAFNQLAGGITPRVRML